MHEGKRPPLPLLLDKFKAVEDLVVLCWAIEPGDRPFFSEVVQAVDAEWKDRAIPGYTESLIEYTASEYTAYENDCVLRMYYSIICSEQPTVPSASYPLVGDRAEFHNVSVFLTENKTVLGGFYPDPGSSSRPI